MPNKPGALSRLAKLIAEEGINILGIASEVRDDSGMVRMAVDEAPAPRKTEEFSRVPTRARKDIGEVLSQGGFPSVESRAISVEIGDRPGALLLLSKALGEGGVNITTVYGTAIGGQTSRVLFAV